MKVLKQKKPTLKVSQFSSQYMINRKERASINGWDPIQGLPYLMVKKFASYLGKKRSPISNHQKLIPKDPSLLKKLGIKKGARINYFASFYGDFARALSKQTNLSATDASKGMSEFVKSRKYKIPFRAIAAQSYPRVKNAYDWSVSFEPFPLIHNGGIELTAMRGLLNKKGLKIISDAQYSSSLMKEKQFAPKLERVAKVYGVDISNKKVKLLTSMQYGQKAESAYVDVITLFTNNIARKKVKRDLMLISAIEKGQAKTESELIAFGLKMGLNEVQVRVSLKRISQLPTLL